VCYFNHFKNLDGLCCCWCFRECKPSFWILKKSVCSWTKNVAWTCTEFWLFAGWRVFLVV
jgi:hypothetical protein